MMKGPGGWEHKYQEGLMGDDVCEICEEPLPLHLEYHILGEEEKE